MENNLIPEQEEITRNEYLGTFRWKRDLKFPVLTKYANTSETFYQDINKWSDYINKRLTQSTFEPYIIDALSYPLSIIYSIESLLKNFNDILNKDNIKEEQNFNIVILGAANKTECRIAMESNYFDEIYYYFLELTGNSSIKVNLYFVGEEVKTEKESYISNNNNNLTYYFCGKNTGDFLKENVMSFKKSNTFFIGMNCGFGAGFMKLTYSWFYDLVKLIKLKFITIFTYTNDFEDKPGEQALIKKLGGNIIYDELKNPFQSMTTYKSQEDENKEENKDDDKGKEWACGNYGFYILYGGDNKTVMKMGKLKEKDAKDLIKDTIKIK